MIGLEILDQRGHPHHSRSRRELAEAEARGRGSRGRRAEIAAGAARRGVACLATVGDCVPLARPRPGPSAGADRGRPAEEGRDQGPKDDVLDADPGGGGAEPARPCAEQGAQEVRGAQVELEVHADGRHVDLDPVASLAGVDPAEDPPVEPVVRADEGEDLTPIGDEHAPAVRPRPHQVGEPAERRVVPAADDEPIPGGERGAEDPPVEAEQGWATHGDQATA